MKILIIRSYPTKFQLDNPTYNIQEIGLAKALIRKGHSCDVVFWSDTTDERREILIDDEKTLTVYYIKALRILKSGVFPKRLDELAENYDVIQCNEYHQYQSWRYAKKFKDKTVILHGPYYSQFNKRYNLLCRIIDFCFLPRYRKLGTQFLTKSALATEFLLSKGIDRSNLTEAGVGIDREVLTCQNADTAPLPEIRDIKDSFFLLYVGAMERRRNILFQLKLFKKLLDRGLACRLVLVGKPSASETEYWELCKQYAAENNLSGKITYIERVEQKDMSRLYPYANVFLFPTEFDIFGMVLLEAMYFGVPVLSTFNGGSATLMQKPDTGYLMNGCDLDAWSAAIEDLYHHPEHAERISCQTKKTIEDGFTWEILCEAYIKGYEKKLNQ